MTKLTTLYWINIASTNGNRHTIIGPFNDETRAIDWMDYSDQVEIACLGETLEATLDTEPTWSYDLADTFDPEWDENLSNKPTPSEVTEVIIAAMMTLTGNYERFRLSIEQAENHGLIRLVAHQGDEPIPILIASRDSQRNAVWIMQPTGDRLDVALWNTVSPLKRLLDDFIEKRFID